MQKICTTTANSARYSRPSFSRQWRRRWLQNLHRREIHRPPKSLQLIRLREADMLNAGVLRFSPEGRVVCTGEGSPVIFSGGVPLDITGAVCVSPSAPDLFLEGLGYRNSTRLCAGVSPVISNPDNALGRDAVGGLALAETEPITQYYCGLPLTADGRVAVFLEAPIFVSAFSLAYDDLAFN